MLAALRSGYALPPTRQHPRHSNLTISDRSRLPPVTFPREAIRGGHVACRWTRLKKLVAERDQEIEVMKEINAKKW